jgi:hypothetical protein
MSKKADEKFYALRNSGYKGPIDQDGNRADDRDDKMADALKALGKLPSWKSYKK